jgi:hypothetical protein
MRGKGAAADSIDDEEDAAAAEGASLATCMSEMSPKAFGWQMAATTTAGKGQGGAYSAIRAASSGTNTPRRTDCKKSLKRVVGSRHHGCTCEVWMAAADGASVGWLCFTSTALIENQSTATRERPDAKKEPQHINAKEIHAESKLFCHKKRKIEH